MPTDGLFCRIISGPSRSATVLSPTPNVCRVRDTIAAIFRQPAYARDLRESTWDRFVGWIARWLDAFLSAPGRAVR